jgi:hypothetical protein
LTGETAQEAYGEFKTQSLQVAFEALETVQGLQAAWQDCSATSNISGSSCQTKKELVG